MEVLSVWLAAALALIAVGVIVRSSAGRGARATLVIAMIAAAIALARPRAVAADAIGPRVVHDGGYIGSGACRACHPGEHASWSRTYHRTMTQRGTPPVAITTGSHHMQGYWTEDDQGVLHMLPVVFARDEGRFIARRDAFLEPPDAPQHDVRWRSNCIACHATGGQPSISARDAIVGELGIACEACHGPGAVHAGRQRNPLVRWAGERDSSIVNPARLPPERASAVCGSCHAYAFPRAEEAFLHTGYTKTFQPGDALEPSRIILTPEVLARGDVELDTDSRNLFWPDGTVRVGGREHNAMILSACYLRGEGDRKITCMSCHSMHRSDPDDQLREDRSVETACLSCHTVPPDHAHHAKGSPGSACVACHMPKTSYALRTAIRSHRIESPGGTAKPDACNLCHLDRSVTWAMTERARLWHTPMPEIDVTVPASVVGILMGDAAERVIWADAFGDSEAIRASGSDWQVPVLAIAERDPYAVIRFIAHRSAKAYAPSPVRSIVSQETLDALVAKRDNRDVYIAE